MFDPIIQVKPFLIKLPDLFFGVFKGCDQYPEHKIVYASRKVIME